MSTNRLTGERTLQFVLAGKRKSIWLGKIADDHAAVFKRHIEKLVTAKKLRQYPSNGTAEWVKLLDIDYHKKLSAVGLVQVRPTNMKLREFVRAFIRSQSVKETTIDKYVAIGKILTRFFGNDKRIADITEANASEFRLWLREPVHVRGQPYAKATERRICSMARQFFRKAWREHLITSNPFNRMGRLRGRPNCKTWRYVGTESIDRVIASCKTAEWRLLIALARYGGLRCPSELAQLRWRDINWTDGSFVVHSPKTEYMEGHGIRTVPILPQLKDHLCAAYACSDSTEFVIAGGRTNLGTLASSNYRTQLARIITRSGQQPWPKLFNSLRKSCSRDLVDAGYSIRQVAAWMGWSIATAEFYLQNEDDTGKGAA